MAEDELVDVMVDHGGPPGPARKRRDMARMCHNLEFMADKESIYEGAVLPVSCLPVAVVTEFPSAADRARAAP